ncbi:hypothetical protein J3R82DRAFT_8327 [Butyriboletus roseoflavus]|nr:hypothetical protein J3R82DRAFT_12048 [Butyriboletus roseoflavus]KAG8216270.1 hypothetical protein J3R82DRAFT_8327 [Butyriboletus roseoflavus]
MVRTKQTAKKSTGGEAPRIVIKIIPRLQSAADTALHRPVRSKPLDAPLTPIPDRSCPVAMLTAPSSRDGRVNNDFCHMCGDGGHLYTCDSCPRAACHHCICIPAQHAALVLSDGVRFTCVSCHWRDDVRSGKVSPYVGFYRNGLSVLPEFPTINGDFQLPIHSAISCRKTIVIHLCVHTLPAGGPMLMLQEFLQPYFKHSGELIVRTISFNLTTGATRKQYQQEAAMIAAEIGDIRGANVLITLTSHSEDDRGDIMIGMSRRMKVEVASTVETVLDTLLTPFKRITAGSLFVMFACGAIVNNPSSFDQFCKAITRFNFASAIAFDAVRLLPSSCWPFLVFLAEAVFIEEHDLQIAIPHALGNSNKLGLHSGIYVLTRTTGSLEITRFFWAHRDFRPWGYRLPVQCLVCGTPQQWQRKLGDDFSYTFECRYTRCGQDPVSGEVVQRRGYVEVKKPEGVKTILQGKTRHSGWLSVQVSK